MKQRNLLLVATLMLCFFAANAQNVEKGDKIISLGFGFGNNFTAGGDGFANTLPPLSAAMEVIIKDDILNDGKGYIGVGGFAQYMNYKYSVSDLPYIEGGYGYALKYKSAVASSATTDWKYNKFIIGPRGYFHYSFLENLDTYTGLMLGLDHVSWGTDDTNYKHTGFAWSWFVGGRYYITENLAIMLELGYGATYGNIGVAYKLGN